MFSFEAIQVLVFLLPGFISEAFLNSLQVRKEKSDLGVVVEALVFSMIIYLFYSFVFSKSPVAFAVSSSAIAWNSKALLLLIFFSVLLPLPIAYLMTNDIYMRILRRLRITGRTSRDSVWLDCFIGNQSSIVVNFSDGRRIVGFPRYYSDNPENKYLYLLNPAWIVYDKKDKKERYSELNVDGILITPSQMNQRK
jgi:hypothetical protein